MRKSLEGNHIQIPNATIYKNTIQNDTANPNRRGDFIVGIGDDNALPMAQEVMMQVLTHHPAILGDPPPAVLVEALGAATPRIRVTVLADHQGWSAANGPAKPRHSAKARGSA